MKDLIERYQVAKMIIINQGFQNEILWQSSVIFEDLDATTFMRELAWVVLSSGMRERVIRKIFYKVSDCFFNWSSIEMIANNADNCFNEAITFFNHRSKIAAIIYAAKYLNDIEFNEFKLKIKEDPINVLQQFPFIGPITAFHLAKNIGIPIAKPDRHLVRLAHHEGFQDIQNFCMQISKVSGDSVPVVDIVLWRFATIEKNYLIKFREL